MSKTGNFLWKLFCALVVFFYHKPDDAHADTTTMKLCSFPNQYVVSCKNYKVGFEWLKGGTIDGATIREKAINTLTVPNYANSNFNLFSSKQKIDALKYFFAQAGGNPESLQLPENYSMDNAADVAFNLLSLLCSEPSDVVCATCDGGFVEDSLYQYDETGIMANTWKFYTIADCYKFDFANQTGTFNYVDLTSNNPIKFYYKPDVAAAQLVGTALPNQPAQTTKTDDTGTDNTETDDTETTETTKTKTKTTKPTIKR